MIAPFNVNVLPAPIETNPNTPVPPPNVVVPFTVTVEESVTDGVATAPLKVFVKLKLLIVAGNKAPVVCATEPLNVKLVLLLAPFVKLKDPVPGNVPFTPLA